MAGQFHAGIMPVALRPGRKPGPEGDRRFRYVGTGVAPSWAERGR